MKQKLSFKDFKVADKQILSSEFLNEVFDSFMSNIIYVYHNFKTLVARINNFKINVITGVNWYVIQAAVMYKYMVEKFTFSGYNKPDSSTNIEEDIFNGALYLKPKNIQSKIQRYLDDVGQSKSFNSTKIDFLDSQNQVLRTQEDIRKVIDSDQELWSTTIKDNNSLSSPTATVLVSSNGVNGNNLNLIDIYPYGGTKVVSIRIRKPDNTYYEFFPNSQYPFKVASNVYGNGQVEFKLEGVRNEANDGYYYGLRYIKLNSCQYADTGEFTYNIGKYSNIRQIILNNDYIDDKLKTKNPIRIQLYYIEDSLDQEIYDTADGDPFPLQSDLSVDPEIDIVMKITLYKKEDTTPVIRFIRIEGDQIGENTEN